MSRRRQSHGATMVCALAALVAALFVIPVAAPATAAARPSAKPAKGPAPTPTPTPTPSPTPTPAPAPAAPAQYFGFNDHSAKWGQVSADTAASLSAQAGATVHRMTIVWKGVERTQGTYDFSAYDAIYSADVARGIHPVFQLINAPAWARDPSVGCDDSTTDCRYPPGSGHLDAWRAFAAAVATRYPQLAAIEIWNEPNLRQSWMSGPDPAYYTTLVKQARDAIRAAGSGIPVLAGALAAYTNADTTDKMSYASFLGGMYQAGIKGNMDGLSIHAYPADIDFWRVYKEFSLVRDIRDQAGDNVPLWLTETGATTVGASTNDYKFDENDQAVMLAEWLRQLRAMPDLRAVIVHTLIDPTRFATWDPEYGYGVLHADLTPKPAYCTIASFNLMAYACPAGVPAPVSDPAQDLRWKAQVLVQRAADAARAYRKVHGTYTGLTSAGLHEIDPAISAEPEPTGTVPGPSVDPSRMFVYLLGEALLVCNTSQADRSYCILTEYAKYWNHSSAVGTINDAASSVINGTQWWW